MRSLRFAGSAGIRRWLSNMKERAGAAERARSKTRGLAGCCDWIRSSQLLRADGPEDSGGGELDDFKALGQKRCIACVHLDVVARSVAHLQANGLTHDEGHGFSLGFADGLRGHGATFGLVQELVRLC